MRTFVLSFGAGFLSSIAAYYLTQLWVGWPSWGRWATTISVGVVVVTVSLCFSHRRHKPEEKDVVASRLRGNKQVRIDGVAVGTDANRPTEVASDIKSNQDIVISNVKVRRSRRSQDEQDTNH